MVETQQYGCLCFAAVGASSGCADLRVTLLPQMIRLNRACFEKLQRPLKHHRPKPRAQNQMSGLVVRCEVKGSWD